MRGALRRWRSITEFLTNSHIVFINSIFRSWFEKNIIVMTIGKEG